MRLSFHRTERQTWLGRRIYRLSVGIEATAEELHLLHRHRLFSTDVWLSPAASTLHAEAESAFEQTRAVRSWRLRGVTSTLGHLVEGYSRARQSESEARVAVRDLLAGLVLEAHDVGELTATEAGVRAGVEHLTIKLRHLASFDDGEETITEAEGGEASAHPAQWIRMRVR